MKLRTFNELNSLPSQVAHHIVNSVAVSSQRTNMLGPRCLLVLGLSSQRQHKRNDDRLQILSSW